MISFTNAVSCVGGAVPAQIRAPISSDWLHFLQSVTYLADSVILMRFFEAGGEVKKAISVIKKRSGGHEKAIREFLIDSKGVRVGEPLYKFHGVLTGMPTSVDDLESMMKSR